MVDHFSGLGAPVRGLGPLHTVVHAGLERDHGYSLEPLDRVDKFLFGPGMRLILSGVRDPG